MADESSKRRGRRPNPEPGSAVCTWLTESEHDQLALIALLNRMSISRLVAETVRVSLLKKSDSATTA
jgi:hypothetical protein